MIEHVALVVLALFALYRFLFWCNRNYIYEKRIREMDEMRANGKG